MEIEPGCRRRRRLGAFSILFVFVRLHRLVCTRKYESKTVACWRVEKAASSLVCV